MPTKFQLITELYDQTVQSVTGSYQSWTGFLRAACYNYKCPFDEQLLIYAQRPDATAVLEMERWNRQFGRWVNRGAKSIAVFGDDGQNCLKLYFDVSDTHASRFARPLPIWTMHPAFEPEVIETLEATFGNLAEKENLADAVRSACHNAVADNITDYLQDLRDCREDSLLEELDPHTPEEHQKFIKSQFGEYSGGGCAGYNHSKTHKGLEYVRDYGFKKYDTVHLTIPNVVKEYERLITQKRFPGEDAIAKIPEYERGQLARIVYNGFYNAPDDVPRPYPKGADYYDALPMIEEQLQDKGKTAEMLAALISRLDGTDVSDRFYDSVRRAKDRLSEYVDGTFSLFNHRHDAPQQERSFVEQVAEDAARLAAEQPPAYERFSVIETDDGYAVWDDIRDEIYVDSEGVRETFPSEWQAEDYLEQVRKAVNEKEAAEWLYVEQSRNTAAKPEQPQSEPVSTADPVIVGTRLTIDGRQFEVDSVDDHTQNVSLRDVTFEGGTGFPIFRKESIEYVRAHMEQPDIAWETAAPQADEPPAVLTPPKKKKPNALAYPLDADGRNYRITDDHIGEGAPLERFQRNLDAIRTLKAVEAENRAATAEEQAVLAQYVGWGGLADFFDEKNPRYAELKELLTDAEYAAARESTLTAFFTPPVVIRGIYAALGQMGFTQGNILEPACGIGNFLGMLPERMSGSKLYGVELDDLSGRIARQLYQKSSIAVQGYEKTSFPDNFFDVAIGNVPFGQFHVPDKRYDRLNFPIHEYFVAKALDQVRPGGVIAVVTSSYTMDKRTASARKYIAQRAELLGAIRLPNNAFKAAAGTEVVSDILFLQKRERMVDRGQKQGSRQCQGHQHLRHQAHQRL